MNMIYININSIQAQVKHLNSDMKKDYKSSNKMMKRMENDMDMIEKKYDMNGKLVKLGFNTHDINLNLKKDLKQNINMASKNFRKLKIIKYY